ncbi:hypothetical protein [Haloferula sp. A504]|uniref:hypothetical protein n=1 Tax=Haloferula sp. A504 TaxID=3373601 RepID=UPI0031C63645|nr:hypothetical protein [Verrucomicrobiaceae bacterium E54]
MNPYETPKAAPSSLDGRIDGCRVCGGRRISHVDRRFPKMSMSRMLLYGWVVRIFLYGFGAVFDQCEDCGDRLFNKPTTSAVAAMLMTFAVVGGLPVILFSVLVLFFG